jgi:hypothetical protein
MQQGTTGLLPLDLKLNDDLSADCRLRLDAFVAAIAADLASRGLAVETAPIEPSYNHGIHGIQDLCSLLARNGKSFAMEAGHRDRADVIYRLLGHFPAAKAARVMGWGGAGRIGEAFEGMGDFAITPERVAAAVARGKVRRTAIGVRAGRLGCGGMSATLPFDRASSRPPSGSGDPRARRP